MAVQLLRGPLCVVGRTVVSLGVAGRRPGPETGVCVGGGGDASGGNRLSRRSDGGHSLVESVAFDADTLYHSKLGL